MVRARRATSTERASAPPARGGALLVRSPMRPGCPLLRSLPQRPVSRERVRTGQRVGLSARTSWTGTGARPANEGRSCLTERSTLPEAARAAAESLTKAQKRVTIVIVRGNGSQLFRGTPRGCGAGIRTPTSWSRARRPTVRRPRNGRLGTSRSPRRALSDLEAVDGPAASRPPCRCARRPRRTAPGPSPGASPSAARRPGRCRTSCS